MFSRLNSWDVYFAKLSFRHIDDSKDHEEIFHKYFLRPHLGPGAIINLRLTASGVEAGCVSMQAQHCTSQQLFIPTTQHWRELTNKTVCVGSQFRSFQSAILWFHAFEPEARHYIKPDQDHSHHHQEARENEETPEASSKTHLQPLKDISPAHSS